MIDSDDSRVRAAVRALFQMQADKLRAMADWFTDCKTLTLENLPVGLIAALRAGADALEIVGSATESLSEASTDTAQERSAEEKTSNLDPPAAVQPDPLPGTGDL